LSSPIASPAKSKFHHDGGFYEPITKENPSTKHQLKNLDVHIPDDNKTSILLQKWSGGL
jgi:hypothetical protein